MTEAIDKRKIDDKGDVTLEGKKMAEVQREKIDNSISLADDISGEEQAGSVSLKDEHYMKLCDYKMKAESLEANLKAVAQEAQKYGMGIAKDYGIADGEKFVISLLERSIKKVD